MVNKLSKTENLNTQLHGANVAEIARYNGCRPEEIIDFSSNINPLGPSELAEFAIVEHLRDIANYPDNNNELNEALADYLDVDAGNLFLDNGSAALIYKLFPLLNLKNVAIFQPTFGEYERAAVAYNSKDNLFSLSDLIGQSSKTIALDYPVKPGNGNESCEALFLCNPNNPTAELKTKEEIIRLAEVAAKNNAYLIVDEAFMDFVKEKEAYSVKDQILRLPNLIVLGSLTKFFALAGLRLGYVCACTEIIDKLNKTNPPWLISTLATQAALASLNDKHYIKKTLKEIPVLRQDLLNQLSVVSCQLSDNQSKDLNFVLVKTKLSSTFVYQELAKRKVLVRDCSSFGMDNYFRLAVKAPREHRILAEALREVLDAS